MPIEPDSTDDELAGAGLAGRSLADLRAAAIAGPVADAPAGEAKRKTYLRSAAVRRYVLARADGICEGYGAAAPFITPRGEPYLEPHHTRRLSDGGPDHPAIVIALCPTCHRRVHNGADGDEYNRALVSRLDVVEPGDSSAA